MAKDGLSPMMTEYKQMKEKYKDCIIFYRLGDFYELFFEDAQEMCFQLDLTLTQKLCGKINEVQQYAPMCGVPAKSVNTYVQKAVNLGYKIAICEQVGQIIQGKAVKREIVRIITPGTIIENEILDGKKNNYIACIFLDKKQQGAIAWSDITTGIINTAKIDNVNEYNLCDILSSIMPSEIICNEETLLLENKIVARQVNAMPKFSEFKNTYNAQFLKENILEFFKIQNLTAFDIDDKPNCIIACGALIEYLKETQFSWLPYFKKINLKHFSEIMQLDFQTRKNLELVKNNRDGSKSGTLLSYLDKTHTRMGSRTLVNFIEQPLQNLNEITLRLDAVEEIYKNIIKREALISNLKLIFDLERLAGRICTTKLTPKDLIDLKNSLKIIPNIKQLLSDCSTTVIKHIYNSLNCFESVTALIESALLEPEHPATNLNEAGFIKKGYNKVLDEYMLAEEEGLNWIASLQIEEQRQTGIKNLKIVYARNFGYTIEVLNSQKDLVPFRYDRKQTLSNCERYTTVELLDLENKITVAKNNRYSLEVELFENLKNTLTSYIGDFQETARLLGYLDCLCSFATVANKNNLCKPSIVPSNDDLNIVNGRHPVVESIGKDGFVPNNTAFSKDSYTMIITGPNMAGKSTYMRQVAIITIMAHIGCFVPATSATIPITDRIFTRIGATDDLAFGQSTFMVEMNEVARILQNATKNSLIILDEIGRGTSTFDGLSIAWSVMEYICKNIKAKTLFSTHYHQLTELEGKLEGVKNYSVSVREVNGEITFLRKIIRGGTNKSFGIDVAKLAGLPLEVISKAREILQKLESNENSFNNMPSNTISQSLKTSEKEALAILKEVVPDKLTPLESMSILYDLVKKLNEK